MSIPAHFCWSKYGTEAGESVSSILARKERERLANDGLFLWGMGNSVGKAIHELVRLEPNPKVVFSPIRSPAKDIDVSPTLTVHWHSATTMDGTAWQIPAGLAVPSRATTVSGRVKSFHYALVCRSSVTIVDQVVASRIRVRELANLISGREPGASQVTSVVRRNGVSVPGGIDYPVGFIAELVRPYFVKLGSPRAE